MNIKNIQNFTLIPNPLKYWKKVLPKKVIFQKLLQVTSIEETKLQFRTLALPLTFLLENVSHFSQRF